MTIDVYLDDRRMKSNGTYPVKLRVTHIKKRKYYATGISMTKGDFAFLDTSRKFARESKKLAKLRSKALEISDKLSPFTFEDFEERFLDKSQINDIPNVTEMFQNYIDTLEGAGRVGTAIVYKNTIRAYQVFSGKTHIAWKTVTPQWLQDFEQHHIGKGGSQTTVSMYARALRAIFNKVIAQGYISKNVYPFGSHKYVIPNSKNVKKALDIKDVRKIMEYQPVAYGSPKGGQRVAAETIARWRDLWVFSYLCNGANIQDIARLKTEHVQGDVIVFTRTKTKQARKGNQKSIAVPITPHIEAILKRWGNPSGYIFGILQLDLSPQQEKATINQTTKNINKYIRLIAKEVGIEKDVTTYTARHSFASRLNQVGAPITFISEALGHSNTTTTLNYINSFDIETKKQYSNMLLG